MIFDKGQTFSFRGKTGPARAARFVAESRGRAELVGLRSVRLLVSATLTLAEPARPATLLHPE